MEVKNYLFAAAKDAGVLGAIRDILKNNPQLRGSIMSYATWVGPNARKRDGSPLLSTVIGEATRAYRKLLPNFSAANRAFRKVLEDSAEDCAYIHYVGETESGNRYEWNIAFGDAATYMEEHPEVKEWRFECRPFQDKQTLTQDFMRAFVIIKTVPVSLWPTINLHDSEETE